MTSPTPEQMRGLARRGPGPDESAGWANDARAALRAAADEVDRLREKLSRIASHPLLFAYTRDSVDAYGAVMPAMKWVHEEFAGTKRERDSLRAVIENAPHEHSHGTPCYAGILGFAKRACWKADAL